MAAFQNLMKELQDQKDQNARTNNLLSRYVVNASIGRS